MAHTFRYKGPGYYETRDGRKALVGQSGQFLVGLIINDFSNDTCSWDLKGRFAKQHPFNFDLVGEWPEPIKVEGWVNVYPDSRSFHRSKSIADKVAGEDRIACVRVEGVDAGSQSRNA